MKAKVVDGGVMGELEKDAVVGGRWKVVLRLDSGGSSLVYLVVEIGGLGRTAALKIRRLDTEHPRELFENEIRFLRDQPIRGDMPEWFDDGEHEGRPYVVMTRLRKLPRPMTVREAKRYFHQAAKILKRLHALKIIHGDIKLDNFALMGDKLVLTDFATAQHVEEGKDSVPVVMTPLYAAPELNSEKKPRLTYKTDVYAFGVAFEFACTDEAVKVFDKVHRLTVAATPNRRSDDWDAIGRAIWWAGRRWQIVAAVFLSIFFVGAAVGGGIILDSRDAREKRIKRVEERPSAKSFIPAAFAFYESGHFAQAYECFVKGKNAADYNPKDYEDMGDVDGLLQDSYWRMHRKEE